MPKIVDHDERRRSIAAAACAAIAEQGLEGATLAQVARRCKLTTGAIAHYFRDKDALLAAAMLESYRLQIERMDKHLSKPEYSLLDVLSEALPVTKTGHQLMKVWLAFWGRAVGDKMIADAQRSIHERWLQRVRGELQRGIHHNVLPAAMNVDDEAEALIAQIRGLCIRALFETKCWDRKRQLAFLERYLNRLSAPVRPLSDDAPTYILHQPQ